MGHCQHVSKTRKRSYEWNAEEDIRSNHELKFNYPKTKPIVNRKSRSRLKQAHKRTHVPSYLYLGDNPLIEERNLPTILFSTYKHTHTPSTIRQVALSSLNCSKLSPRWSVTGKLEGWLLDVSDAVETEDVNPSKWCCRCKNDIIFLGPGRSSVELVQTPGSSPSVQNDLLLLCCGAAGKLSWIFKRNGRILFTDFPSQLRVRGRKKLPCPKTTSAKEFSSSASWFKFSSVIRVGSKVYRKTLLEVLLTST